MGGRFMKPKNTINTWHMCRQSRSGFEQNSQQSIWSLRPVGANNLANGILESIVIPLIFPQSPNVPLGIKDKRKS